jgi:hypothetical protein
MLKHVALYESFQSQKDLEHLAHTLLNFIAESTVQKLESNIHKIRDFESVFFKQLNPDAFGSLSQFIKDFNNIEIHIITEKEFREYSIGIGCYLRTKNEDGTNHQRMILIVEDNYALQKANEYVEKWNYDNTEDVVQQITERLWATYKTTLIHELQHAHDDWRSNGKYDHTPREHRANQAEYEKLAAKKLDDLKEEEREFHDNHYIEYLNLGYEVDARFTAAVANINFAEWDIDKSFEINKDVYVLKPFSEVLRQFKSNFQPPFVVLQEDQKKRVLRKLGQFYELERDFIAKKNTDSKSY